MRLVAVIMAVGLMAGCTAESANTPNMLLATGHMRVMPHPTEPNLVVVQHLNTFDVGYNMDDAAARRTVVRNLLRAQCGQPEIVDARVTLTGDPGAVRQGRTYTLTVRCPNGASSPAER